METKITEKGIQKNKLFLYVTEFFAGMSVMAVELGASRLLAPYFSSSQIVWTIIIGTIMIAIWHLVIFTAERVRTSHRIRISCMARS